jgi:APA family basic amino acid/polyamine antiporter
MEENLKRVLRTPEVLFIGINGVVGGGIFLLPGQVAGLAGSKALWAYLVAGIIAILIGLVFAEASSMFTRTGGSYVYAEEAMGKAVGFTVGWMGWLTFVVGWAALSNGLVSYLAALVHGIAPYKISSSLWSLRFSVC